MTKPVCNICEGLVSTFRGLSRINGIKDGYVIREVVAGFALCDRHSQEFDPLLDRIQEALDANSYRDLGNE